MARLREDGVLARMKILYTAALLVLPGVGLGAVAITQHAPATTTVYYVAEVEVTNLDGYLKEYVPRFEASIKAFGGRILASGTKVASIEGEPPKPRVAVVVWDDIEKIQIWRNSAQFKEIRAAGDKFAKFRAFTVEGL
jgi:uncharacterized protein (DUF1330 family)